MEQIIRFDDVDQNGPQHRSGVVTLSASDLDRHELDGVGAVSIDISLRRGDPAGEYVASGQVSFSADLRCSRCLDPFPVATVSPFTIRFRPRPAPTEYDKDQEIEITEAELDVEYYSERAVALRDLAAEQIQISLSMKPLCEDACLGLCPTCGSNLNRESCSCATEQKDVRWGALRDIREQLAKKKQV